MSNSVSALAQKYDLPPEHANWMEAFNFTRVSELPLGSKKPVSYSGLLNAAQSRQVYGDGTFGGPYSAEQNIMDELFDVCLQDIIYFLKFPELK
jgi:creatinine amidohydrolase